jgi:hypothetical protein
MNPASGFIGSSSFGETRLWRNSHGMKVKNDMMREAVELWKEVERESGQTFLLWTPVLTIGSEKR